MSAKIVSSVHIKGALAKKHEGKEFFLAECKNGPTHVPDVEGLVQFDAVAIHKSWSHPRIVGYEIKTTRGDFLRDAKYTMYLPYVHEFYFVTPSGLVQRHEVEENIGLMWYNPDTGALRTKKKAVYRKIEISARMLLYIIMSRLEGDRYPFHSTQAEYWRDWLANKLSNRELGWTVRGKVAGKLSQLESELSKHKDATHTLKEIQEVMTKHGLRRFGDVATVLDRALAKTYPVSLDVIRGQLENGMQAMQRTLREIDAIKTRSALGDDFGDKTEGVLYPVGEEG
ncbi:MAG: hypothetical protein KGZ53_03665 [Peptococcaceae bacterium]|nr:hypothetical protein [Peptococcaceae bacterium]